MNLRWSETISRMRRAAPDAPITVWCNEDSPVIWHDILTRLAGLSPDVTLRGSYEFPAELLTDDGRTALKQRLKDDPPKRALEKRELLAELLHTHAREDLMVEDISASGWSQDLMDDLSAQYDADLDRIAKMDGVTLLTP